MTHNKKQQPARDEEEKKTDYAADSAARSNTQKQEGEAQAEKKEGDMPALDSLQAECDKYKAGWQRAQADYQNLQREVSQQKSEWIKMSEWQILEEFIPVYDNFKKAFASQPETEDKTWQGWAQGIGFIQKQFADILKQHGIEEIQTVGERFDPHLHECVGEETDEAYDADVVVKEIDTGYKMGDTVLKAAKVVVNKI